MVWTALTTCMVSIVWVVTAAAQYRDADDNCGLYDQRLSNVGVDDFGAQLSSYDVYLTRQQLAY